MMLLAWFFCANNWAEDDKTLQSERLRIIEVPQTSKIVEVMTVEGSYIRSDNKPEKISITANEIALIQPSAITGLLRTLPGVNVTQQGGEGGLTFISLRGGEPNFTVVTIDGVKVNDTTNSRGGGFDLAGLDPLIVKNIDVFLGGFSSIYGSEALGGVLSITTYDPDFSDRVVSFEAGTDSALATATKWSGNTLGDARYSFAAVRRQAAEYIPGDKLERDQLNVQLFSPADSIIQWRGSWFYTDGDARGFPEDSGGDQLASADLPLSELLETRSFRQNNLRLAASSLIATEWTIDAAASYSSHNESIANPGIAEGELSGVPPLVSQSEFQRQDFSVIANYQGGSAAIALGTELSREQGDFESLIDFGVPIPADFNFSRDNVAIFAEAMIDVSSTIALTGSLRRDDIDQFQEQTYALQTSYVLPRALGRLSLRYGEGFKVPSFFALGHPLVGNAELQPEESENVSLNFSRDFLSGRLSVSTSLFQNQFTNLIDFDPVLFTNVNRSKINVEGFEGQAEWSPRDDFVLDTSITYSEYNSSEDIILRRRPEWKYSASAFWEINSLTDVNIRAWYVDDFFDSSIPTGIVTTQGYHQVDASLARELSDQLQLGFVVSNLMDNDYQEAVGFSNSGRQFRLSLTVKL